VIFKDSTSLQVICLGSLNVLGSLLISQEGSGMSVQQIHEHALYNNRIFKLMLRFPKPVKVLSHYVEK